MILEHGDMWSVFNSTDVFVISTNSYITKSEKLVMGRGIALALKQRFPEFPRRAGRCINHLTCYGFLSGLVRDPCTKGIRRVGLFQVKYDWRDPAQLELIKFSVSQLIRWISKHSPIRVDMNFPGIGNGKLKRADVLPLLSILPNCVHVWERARAR